MNPYDTHFVKPIYSKEFVSEYSKVVTDFLTETNIKDKIVKEFSLPSCLANYVVLRADSKRMPPMEEKPLPDYQSLCRLVYHRNSDIYKSCRIETCPKNICAFVIASVKEMTPDCVKQMVVEQTVYDLARHIYCGLLSNIFELLFYRSPECPQQKSPFPNTVVSPIEVLTSAAVFARHLDDNGVTKLAGIVEKHIRTDKDVALAVMDFDLKYHISDAY